MVSRRPASGQNDAGVTVPLAHACGHDLHMTGWLGTAAIMAARKDRWHGTLMLVGQPAEEIVGGASAMLSDGLFSRFPKPEIVIGIHDEPTLPSGQVGFHAGFFRASADTIEVTIFGRGGHGAYPQRTVDPIVIAARSVLGPAQMGSEHFSQYGRAGAKAVLLHIGAVDPTELASGKILPGLHSAQWAPQLEPTLRSMVAAEVVVLTDLLKAPH